MKSLYEQAQDYIRILFPKGGTVRHLVRTAEWAKTLKPDADEPLLVAAVLHDIERAHKDNRPPEVRSAETRPDFSVRHVYMRFHQEEGARLSGDFLQKLNADPVLVAKVCELVACHEDGGTPDGDILQAADSLSFFENNINHFLNDFVPVRGIDYVRLKFQYMFTRIVVPKAKEVARPMFEDAMRRLSKLEA